MASRLITVWLIVGLSIAFGGDSKLFRHQYVISGAPETGYMVAVERDEGVLFVRLPSASHDWTMRMEDSKIELWKHAAKQEDRRYLCFRESKPRSTTSDSKSPLVFLAAESRQNSVWEVEVEKVVGSELRFFLKVTTGDYKGWYLCPGEPVDNLRTSNSPKIGFQAKAVTLCPDKKPSFRLGNGTEGK